MKIRFLLFILATSFFFFRCGNNDAQKHVAFNWIVDSAKFDFAKYVDPMIGTAGHGHTFPGATAPFGMVQLSPDTRVDGSWDGCSGYHYDDSIIYGFSHTHLSGTGCSDYGDILFMPGNHPRITSHNGADGKEGYRSTFSHKNEKAEAGYYSVVLDNSQTKVELTASPRVGVHRYTFANNKNNWLLLDLVHRDEVIDSHLEIINKHAIQGYRFSKAWATNQKVYFYAEFSTDFEKYISCAANDEWDGTGDNISGKNVKACFSFPDGMKSPVILKVAISSVSAENAKLNMQTEVPDFDFDAVRKKVQQQWNSELGKIEVVGADVTKKRIFYTALYHCFISPNVYCDVNGDYRGRDDQIHSDTIHPQYTVFSLWDTYRALHPLFTIVQQKRDQDFINTFVKQSKEGGLLPVWELSANETDCMIGYHSVPVIVDAWMKGLTDFDTAAAYEAMKKSAMQDKNGLAAYKKYGFIPAEGESESVSKTLEYAYDDWCISLAAKRMKREDDYNYFTRRAQSWKNLYDPGTGFFRPRLNNSFVEPFNPNEVNFHFTEANAWQYSLAVQQDIPGLIEAHGGDEKFIQFLDSLFSASPKTSGRDQADITGLIGQYAQGNEPSHHMAYLYDFTSQPWKTHDLISKICKEQYTDKPDGLCGNEDCGQMSAWYVLSAMGIYQVTPGIAVFSVGHPSVSVILHLENGKNTKLEYMLDPDKEYLDTPSFKGINVGNDYKKKTSIDYATIMNGSYIRMEYTRLRRYESEWQNALLNENKPSPIYFNTLKIPSVPIIQLAGNGDYANDQNIPTIDRTFSRQMQLFICGEKTIYVSENNGPFDDYGTGGHIDLYETSTLRAFSKNESGICSDTISFSYLKIPGGRLIRLNSAYAPQYAANGNNALIDGIRGSANFRTGDWQGYEGKDIDAVIDLGTVKDVSKISIGCLQDQNAWIFFPSEVIFYVSTDGKNFTEIETTKNTIAQNTTAATLHDFSTAKPTKARYIKVVTKNPGPCPAWHPGKGSPTWLFADEILIDAK